MCCQALQQWLPVRLFFNNIKTHDDDDVVVVPDHKLLPKSYQGSMTNFWSTEWVVWIARAVLAGIMCLVLLETKIGLAKTAINMGICVVLWHKYCSKMFLYSFYFITTILKKACVSCLHIYKMTLHFQSCLCNGLACNSEWKIALILSKQCHNCVY